MQRERSISNPTIARGGTSKPIECSVVDTLAAPWGTWIHLWWMIVVMDFVGIAVCCCIYCKISAV